MYSCHGFVWKVKLQLIFFLAVGTVLCFGFRMRAMLTTCWCPSSWQTGFTLSREVFSFSHQLIWKWAGRYRKLTGSTARMLQTGLRDIPYHAESCSVYTREKTGWGLLLRNWLGIGWLQLYCASLVLYLLIIIIIIIHSFPVLLKSLHLNPLILLFFPPILSPTPLGRGEQESTCVVSSCLLSYTRATKLEEKAQKANRDNN